MGAEKILVVDDEPDICALVSDILTDEGFSVTAAETAANARKEVKQGNHDLVLLDIWMPDEDGITLLKDWKEKQALQCPVIMMSGHGTVDTAVEATRLGACGFIEKPLTTAKLITSIKKALENQVEEFSDEDLLATENILPPVGNSEVIKNLKALCKKYADAKSNVFAVGEEGSGRTNFLRYMHVLGQTKNAKFEVVTPDSFTQPQNSGDNWSRQKIQIIESIKQNAGGTLYFRNVNRLPADIGKKLIDLLNQLFAAKVFNRFNVRICISIDKEKHHKLAELLQTKFGMARVDIPALNEHSEDIPELVNHFIDQYCAGEDYPYRKCSIAAQNALLHYAWPNNIAELRSLIQELLILGGDEEISLDEVKQALTSKPSGVMSSHSDLESLFNLPLREAREAFEKQYLIKQLDKVDGSVSKLSDLVGMERTNLYRKLRALGIGSK